MKILHLAAVSLALAALTGCGDNAPSVKIGLNTELTGEMPAVGASSKNAAELFVSQINAAGGVKVGDQTLPIKLVIGDNGAKADQAAAVAQRLITQDDVLAMIGPDASACAIPAADIAEAAKMRDDFALVHEPEDDARSEYREAQELCLPRLLHRYFPGRRAGQVRAEQSQGEDRRGALTTAPPRLRTARRPCSRKPSKRMAGASSASKPTPPATKISPRSSRRSKPRIRRSSSCPPTTTTCRSSRSRPAVSASRAIRRQRCLSSPELIKLGGADNRGLLLLQPLFDPDRHARRSEIQ